MSLQFVMGPSGAGKSHYLYQYVINESIANPGKNYIFLVPDQFKMQAEKALVAASPRKGLINIEVLSFNRLAYRVMEETGENQQVILNDIGKNFVIRKVAGEQEKNLNMLAGRLKKMGYITEIKSVISEFMQYDIHPDTMDDILEQVKENRSLYAKLSDVKIIYKEFCEFLKVKYITGEEVLDILASVAHRSNYLKDSVLVLDGFTGFTPVQNKLLRELITICEKIVVSVTIDQKEDAYTYDHPYQLFALSKQMVTSLVQIVKETKSDLEDPICLYEKPIWRFKDNPALGFLEQHLFRYSKGQYADKQEAIRIFCAKRPQDEIDFVAQEIRKLVRKGDLRYRNIAVISNDMTAYATQIEQIFAHYQLPYFMDHKRSILLNSCVEYMRSLLAMAEQNFTYESVFRYLQTGLTDISEEDVDLLENYVIALGIKGRKKWQEKWIRRAKHMTEEELEHINQIRARFMESVEEVMESLCAKKKTVLDITSALHTFFLKEELQKRAKKYQVKFEQNGELSLSKEYAQVYRIIIELFDQFVELLGDESVSIKEYCELLDAGLEEAKVGIVPPSVDQVVVGDVERSRMSDIKVVFLIGVNDVYIPGADAKVGILSEYERLKITDSGFALAPGAKEKMYIQKYYLYLLLTKPTQQICLTYSKTSSDGDAIRPSYLIAELMKMFPNLQNMPVPEKQNEKELTKESGISCIVQGLQQKENGLTREWQELYTWYKKQPEWQEKLEELIEASFYQKPDTFLGREAAKRLYGEAWKNGVTQLEKYAACAYAHFLEYGLQLKEREKYEFKSVDLGTLFHGAIERYSKKLEKNGLSWGKLPGEKKNQLIEESVDECIVDYGNSILYSSARNEYIINRLKRMLHRTVWAVEKQLEQGDFIPNEYELSFVNQYQLGKLGKMNLCGKIDRIDTYEDEDHVYIKVIDYKTGEKAFDLGELYYGLQMQLVVYLNEAVKMQQEKAPEKKVIPAGLFYYKMKDPIIEKPEEGTDLEDAILCELKPDGVVNATGDIVNHLDKHFTEASKVIPVSRVKSGELGKKSGILSDEDFQVVMEYAKRKVESIGTKILNGEVEIAPYEMGDNTGCDYCPYKAICGFDEKIPGYYYRECQKLKKEEAIKSIREEAETWE